jgi:SAM-dependent methyltransferase
VVGLGSHRYHAGMKIYDRDYYQRWYRHRADAAAARRRLRRKVALAVAMAEYHLDRPIANVLDIGCGEGAWRAPLLELRPGLDYLGFDSSEYAVQRHGRRRNLHFARFGDFGSLRPCEPVDLLVCSDVVHYIGAAELRRGIAGFSELCRGVAFIDLFCRGDGFDGDTEGFHARPAAWYRKLFADNGLVACGSHAYLSERIATVTSALERC